MNTTFRGPPVAQQSEPFVWQGRIDSEENAEDAVRLHQILEPFHSQSKGVAIVGFCSDEGVRRNKGRPGAAEAPNLIRTALASLPWTDKPPVFDTGDIHCTDGDLEGAHQQLGMQVERCLNAQNFPIVLGGGHEVAYGTWLGLNRYARSLDKMPRVGIINLDAHFDLRLNTNGCSSGTPFYQIYQDCEEQGNEFRYCCLGISELGNTTALFKRASSLNVTYVKDTEMAVTKLPAIEQQLGDFIGQCDMLYLTIDLDVLPAGDAPGVSAPAARGVGLDILEPLIDQIKGSGKLMVADIAEYNPKFDIDGRTARVAARLFHRLAQ